MTVASTSLTDYETVAAELRLTGDVDRALVERLIGVASGALDRFCRRPLAYRAGVLEKLASFDTPKLVLGRAPVAVVQQVAVQRGDQVLPPDGQAYRVDDWRAGILYRPGNWASSAQLRRGLNFDRDPAAGTESKDTWVTLAGGYLTGPQSVAVGAWPGATKTISAGTLCKAAIDGGQVWVATPATAGTPAVTSGTEPSWTNPATEGDTVTDGTVVWTYLGTPGSAGSRGTAGQLEVLLPQGGAVLALPPELEEACIAEVKTRYLGRTRDPLLKSKSVGAASQSWDTKAADSGSICADAAGLARPFRRATR